MVYMNLYSVIVTKSLMRRAR